MAVDAGHDHPFAESAVEERVGAQRLDRVHLELEDGAIPAIGYVCIGRAYPERMRSRMFAVLSTAWVVPGVVGPSVASLVEHAVVAQKSITNVEQLRGKILGISAIGSLTDILMREGLRLNGISEKDVTIVPVGDEGGRLNALQTGRVQAVIISGVQRLTATKMGFRQLIDFSKLPLEVSGSSILVRRSYVAKNPDITLKFLKAWIEGTYLFKAKSELSLGVLKKYVATQDSEVLNAIYEQQKERLSTKPTPYVRVVKSMMYLLSRTRPEVPSASPEGFAEARFINELENAGFFDEMNRQYGK